MSGEYRRMRIVREGSEKIIALSRKDLLNTEGLADLPNRIGGNLDNHGWYVCGEYDAKRQGIHYEVVLDNEGALVVVGIKKKEGEQDENQT